MHEGAQREVICKQILDAAFFVHSELGPGLLENAMNSACIMSCQEEGSGLKSKRACRCGFVT